MDSRLIYLKENLFTQNNALRAVLSLPDRNVNHFKDEKKTRLVVKLRGRIRHIESLIGFEKVRLKLNNSKNRI